MIENPTCNRHTLDRHNHVFFLLMLLIRPATISDVPLLHTMIRELAEFERELQPCGMEEAGLARDGFGPNPKFHALLAGENRK